MPSTVFKDIFPFTGEVARFESDRTRKELLRRIRSVDCVAELELAADLLAMLESAHAEAIATSTIASRVLTLTHTIIEKLSNVLDKIYFTVWTVRLAPAATWSKPGDRATQEKRVVFPIYDPGGLRSSVGSAVYDVIAAMPDLERVIEDAQPRLSTDRWLATLKHVARQKHMRLLPQAEREPHVAIHPGMQPKAVIQSFRVLDLGAGGFRFEITGTAWDHDDNEVPLHPETLRVVMWTSLHIEEVGIDALAFCRHALERVAAVVVALQPFTAAAGAAAGR